MKEEIPLLEIKVNDAEAAAHILVIGVGGAGNNAVNRICLLYTSDAADEL